MNEESQRITRKDFKKAFLSDQCNEIEENNSIQKIRDFSRNLEVGKGHFMQDEHIERQK